jgi:hypothetical protein
VRWHCAGLAAMTPNSSVTKSNLRECITVNSVAKHQDEASSEKRGARKSV